MKKILIGISLALSAPLTAGCAGVGNIQEQVVLRGTQALITAEYAYNGVGQVILPLLRNGTIHGKSATRVRELNAKAIAALNKGKAAQSESGKAAAASEVLSVVAELNNLKG